MSEDADDGGPADGWRDWGAAPSANRGRCVILPGVTEPTRRAEAPWVQVVAIRTEERSPLPYVLVVGTAYATQPAVGMGVEPDVPDQPVCYAGQDATPPTGPDSGDLAHCGMMRVEYGLAGAPQTVYSDIRPGSYALPASSEVRVFVKRYQLSAAAIPDSPDIRFAAALSPWWMGAQTTPMLYTARYQEASDVPVGGLWETRIPPRAVAVQMGSTGTAVYDHVGTMLSWQTDFAAGIDPIRRWLSPTSFVSGSRFGLLSRYVASGVDPRQFLAVFEVRP